MKMKKIAMMMMMVAMVMSATTCMASASVNQVQQKPIKVFYNGLAINFPDQQPIIIGGRTMVPIRFLTEQLSQMEVEFVSQKYQDFIFMKN